MSGSYTTSMPGDQCLHPELSTSMGCCICGRADAQVCPCDSMKALMHLERAHGDPNAHVMREVLGCPLPASDPAPGLLGDYHHVGTFEATCGRTLEYQTPVNLPTLAHYRWHAVYDHLASGDCRTRSCAADLASPQ